MKTCQIKNCLGKVVAKDLCDKCYHYKSYQENKPYKRAVKKAWDDKNRDKVRQQKRANYYKHAFGITLEDYDNLLKAQNNKCKICYSSDPKSKRKTGFQVDHSYVTGGVRGLLCVPCNLAIGHFQDNPSVIREAANYVEKHLPVSECWEDLFG